jgi:hypothetical protein
MAKRGMARTMAAMCDFVPHCLQGVGRILRDVVVKEEGHGPACI